MPRRNGERKPHQELDVGKLLWALGRPPGDPGPRRLKPKRPKIIRMTKHSISPPVGNEKAPASWWAGASRLICAAWGFCVMNEVPRRTCIRRV
jgi:hypothetical protein